MLWLVHCLTYALFQNVLEAEWKKHSILPVPRSSPPPSSAQKVHKVAVGPTTLPEPTPVPVAAAPAPPPARTATPTITTPAAPIPVTPANSSTANYIYTKPVPIRPRSAQYISTEMEVDIISDADGGDEMSTIIERDPENEEIVRQLEKGLPRWTGFGEEGWRQDVSPVS